MAELRRIIRDWDLRFPTGFRKNSPSILESFFFVNVIKDVFLLKVRIETLETFPPKWKGIFHGLFFHFYCLCIIVKVSQFVQLPLVANT